MLNINLKKKVSIEFGIVNLTILSLNYMCFGYNELLIIIISSNSIVTSKTIVNLFM